MICCSPKAIKGLLSQLEFSFCLKDWCKGNYWREEEERTRQVVILNPNVYNILIARHVTVTLFLLFSFFFLALLECWPAFDVRLAQ
jgi:hypothetical protein